MLAASKASPIVNSAEIAVRQLHDARKDRPAADQQRIGISGRSVMSAMRFHVGLSGKGLAQRRYSRGFTRCLSRKAVLRVAAWR